MEERMTDILATLSEALKCTPDAVRYLIEEQARMGLVSATAGLLAAAALSAVLFWLRRASLAINWREDEGEAVMTMLGGVACTLALFGALSLAYRGFTEYAAPALALLDRVT